MFKFARKTEIVEPLSQSNRVAASEWFYAYLAILYPNVRFMVSAP